MIPAVPDEIVRFGREVDARLRSLLGEDFIGAYYVAWIALGGYVAGESDIDILAVSVDRLLDEFKPLVADALWAAARDCPTRGLEFTLYRLEVVASPPGRADFEVKVNGGPRMPSTVHQRSSEEPSIWNLHSRREERILSRSDQVFGDVRDGEHEPRVALDRTVADRAAFGGD